MACLRQVEGGRQGRRRGRAEEEAAYSAGALAGWAWPTDLRRLVIFADADAAGRAAADKLQGRAVRAGLECSVMTPTEVGADWADVWANRVADFAERAA